MKEQVDTLLTLRNTALGLLGSERDHENARRTWDQAVAPRTKTSTFDVSSFVDRGLCPDPYDVPNSFVLNPDTLYAFPPAMLRLANEVSGIAPGKKGGVAFVGGLWIESTLPPSRETIEFTISQCESNYPPAGIEISQHTISLPNLPIDEPPIRRQLRDEDAALSVDFEQAHLGQYSEAQASKDWQSSNGSLSSFLVRPSESLEIREDGDGKYLVKTFPANTFNTSSDKMTDHKLHLSWAFNEKRSEIYFAYNVRASEKFTPVKGGKLPGLCGGSCPVGGEQTTDASSHNERNDPSGNALGWSGRGMWRRNGYLVQYLYHPDQESKYAEDFRYSLNKNDVYLSDGDWHTIENRIVMNDPGKSNGVLEAWYDGRKVLSVLNVRFRDDYSFGIDTLKFTSYFGGHDPSWAPTRTAELHFDDIVLSTKPISH